MKKEGFGTFADDSFLAYRWFNWLDVFFCSFFLSKSIENSKILHQENYMLGFLLPP